MLWLDEYERRARLIPGMLAILPVVIVVAALGLRQSPAIATIGGLVVASGGPVMLANYVRRRGLAVQERLWPQWGGPPTTAMLRHRGTDSQKGQRDDLRSHVANLFGLNLPTETEEEHDPTAADAAYKGAIDQLIRRTRDKQKFRLVFEENKNYGYERNLVGMKPIGLIISLFAGIVLGVATIFASIGIVSLHLADPIVAAVVDLVLFVIWLVLPDEDQVNRVANAYASQLAEASRDLM